MVALPPARMSSLFSSRLGNTIAKSVWMRTSLICSCAKHHLMHLDFADELNLVSTVTLIGALVFTGLQVRAADRARREQAAVTVIETAALSENFGALFRIA